MIPKKLVLLLSVILLISSGYAIAQNQQIDLANEYYQNGEFDKALELYNNIAKRKSDIGYIHKNYLDAMLRTEQYKEAKKYLKKMTKSDPENAMYNIDYSRLLMQMQDSSDAKSVMDDYIGKIKHDNAQLRYAALYMIDYGMYEYAEKCYLYGEKNNQEDFYYELADLYALWGKKELMIEKYLELLSNVDNQLEYVEIGLQERLQKDEEFDLLEKTLLKYIQKNPDKIVYNELMLWYYLQRQEFYKAFFQAKAIDKRKKLDGFKVFEIGRIAINNNDYEASIKIFEYLVDKYKGGPVYAVSKKMLIRSKELLVKNTFPVDKDKIQSLVYDYQQIIDEIGIKSTTADAVRNMALLQAFYLNQRDSAVSILQDLIEIRSIPKQVIAQAKLDLGDIYLLKGEPWEATLLYSQVEKSEKETNLGHEAKLKNAKLSYYTGKFQLAKDHLDILKLATSREISNDAMKLSILIDDNLNLDTTEVAMKEYADIDLLVFQGRYEEAIGRYDKMLIEYKGHSLTDEILWEKANMLIKLGEFKEASKSLEQIVEFYQYDIWADDANFLLGDLYENYLDDKEKAMEYYKNQMIKFKGSSYGVEARKRFRALRGDDIN
ncbi:tetratricopeptide repeat protein [Limibacter armeniacum]|uniref:tetratricopeptide repeat protein n=1 Tax=Limibacter armeniacum TaxID=466084 RepID=UPI002FE60ED4